MLLALLTRILLWAAVGYIIWFILLRFIPRTYLTWLGGLVVLAMIVLSFVDPADQTIGTIWRLLSLPLTPLGAAIVLMASSLSAGIKGIKGRQVAIAFTILLIASVPLVARTLVGQGELAVQRAFEAQREACGDICPVDIPGSADLSRVVAMVVLGENVDRIGQVNEFPSSVVEDTSFNAILTPRLNRTAVIHRDLRQRGLNPFVIVTAGPQAGSAEERADRATRIRQVLTGNGVPPDLVQIESTGMDVHQTGRVVRGFLRERNLIEGDGSRTDGRVMLLAPALLMRRASLTLENQGLQIIARPTDFFAGQTPAGGLTARLSDLIPSVEALRLTTRYWEELLTSMYYFLRGWLPGFNVSWSNTVEI